MDRDAGWKGGGVANNSPIHKTLDQELRAIKSLRNLHVNVFTTWLLLVKPASVPVYIEYATFCQLSANC